MQKIMSQVSQLSINGKLQKKKSVKKLKWHNGK